MMNITKMKVNGIENPLGYQLDKPVLSWVTTADCGTKAVAFRVEISGSEDFSELVFDSGRDEAIRQHAFAPDWMPAPKTRYFWRVTAWSDVGESVVGVSAWFETGLMDEPWVGQWIASPLDKETHPYFHRSFALDGQIESARLYMTGLGLYEAEINGKKVGDEYLAPFCDNYNHRLQYQTYDVTDYLNSGDNAIGILMGNGWYKGRFGFVEGMDELFGDDFLLLGQMEIRYRDGSRAVVATDNSWSVLPSAVQESSIYDGELYDGRKEIAGRATTACDLSDAVSATAPSRQAHHVSERLSPPLQVIESRKPVAVLTTPAGETVLDFGQVMTGWFTYDCKLPEGTKLFLQFGELLQEENFYNANLRSAKAEYTYISDGKPAVIRPHFTFFGFRFVNVVCEAPVRGEDFTACVIHSDLERSGWVETSHPKVNQLISNALWGQKGNFLDIPTDCPQRDERMGWTGDAQVFASTACFNMYTKAFYEKYMCAILDEQRVCEGGVPWVIPDVLSIIDRRQGKTDLPGASCGWSDAATVIPWTLYVQYGDRDALARHYECMKLWVEYIRREERENCGGKRLWTSRFHFGDWLALDNPDGNIVLGGTNEYYLASAYYFYSSLLTSKAAAVLGYEADAAEYATLAAEIRAAMLEEYFEADGRLKIQTQTAHVIALFFGIAREEDRPVLVQGLKDLLDANNGHLTTGFLGTAYLCNALSDVGLSDYAYSLLLNEEYPGWLYEINMGATTVWERWNSVLPNGLVSDITMNSMNHYAYGAIMDWMVRVMCGLNPVEDAPAYEMVRVAPVPDARLDFAKASYDSAYGRYESGWAREGEKITYTVVVPFGGEAVFAAELSGDYLLNGESVKHAGGAVNVVLKPGIHVMKA